VCRLPPVWCRRALFRDAFRQDGKLAEDLTDAYRYKAACYAALAAAGKGEDASGLEEGDRAALRKQALDWLSADVKANRAAAEKVSGRQAVRQRLTSWLRDPRLAGVRDERSLAKLPDEEREQWRKLWANVDALTKVESHR
jgi:hypothetical protein